VIAVIMLMVGGLQYMIGGAYAEAASGAKKMMLGAVGGLVVLLSANLILQMINPKLTNLSSFAIQTVKQSDLDLYLLEHGSVGPDLTGAPADYSGSIPPGGISGPWKTKMTSPEVCGAKDGGSLPMEERKKRLASIINAWKQSASTEGGAIYVHGGNWNCAYSNANEPFLIRQMTGMIKRGQTALFSTDFLASPCGKLASEIASKLTGEYDHDSNFIKNFLDDKLNYEKANKCTDAKHNPKNPKLPVETIADFPRTRGWGNEYDYLLTKRAQKNNLVCGDCGTFMIGLFTACFDKSYTGKMVKDGSKMTQRFSESSANFKSNIEKYLGMLKFGDMIKMKNTGHFVLYTGGHPGVSFEIMEMGGGGAGDTVGKEKAKINAGTPLDASGVTTHASAAKYFKELKMKYETISAYGVIDQK